MSETFTKNFTAAAWFYFQKQANVEVLDVEIVHVDGERLMRATFVIKS